MAIDRVKHNLKDIPTHFIKPIKIFNGVLVIKLMPLSVFAIKIKEPA